jgi:hypothetical protein
MASPKASTRAGWCWAGRPRVHADRRLAGVVLGQGERPAAHRPATGRLPCRAARPIPRPSSPRRT